MMFSLKVLNACKRVHTSRVFTNVIFGPLFLTKFILQPLNYHQSTYHLIATTKSKGVSCVQINYREKI